ncbi:MAG: transcription antitermination factor NusB [Chloroherpetonaceae bacterium]|jgi:N utilization substance protein B|nr:transcription antitermination factor NusB [Bacteroidota bacterium]
MQGKKTKKIESISPDIFAISKTQQVQGNRRLVREKVLQILFAQNYCDTSLNDLFDHIFFRIFKFDIDDEAKIEINAILKPEEIQEIEADIPIHWKSSELEFGRELIAKTKDNQDQCDELISKFSKNWEFDRIALVDKIIMRIAIAEFLYFPQIPLKVTINEALELAKSYSTYNSSFFINGILDAAKSELLQNNLIYKDSKGLIENNQEKKLKDEIS